MKKLLALALIVVFILAVIPCWGAIPHLINYQGMLTDTGGNPLTDTLNITFRIYDQSSSGNMLWDETQNDIEIIGGIFNVVLGSVDPVGLSFDEDYWLEIDVGPGAILTPRIQLTSVGYAYRAEMADTASYAIQAVSAETDSDWTISGDDIYSAVSGNVGIGTTSPEDKLDVDGDIRVRGADIKDASGTNRITITSGGVLNLRKASGGFALSINTEGDVGIGTMDPDCRLHIMEGLMFKPELLLEGATYGRMIIGDSNDNENEKYFHISADGERLYIGKIQDSFTSWWEQIVLKRNGNLGIGTSDPDRILDVDGQISLRPGASVPNAGIWLKTQAGVDEWYMGKTNVGGTNQIGFWKDSWRMVVQDDGQVGVGTTSPDAVLDIYGTRNISATKDGIVNIGTSEAYHVTLDQNEIHARNGSSTSNLFINDFGGDVLIARNGGVGIGVYSPVTKLTVKGLTGSGAGYPQLIYNSSDGAIYYASSSEKYKERIQPLEEDFYKIMKAQPKSFIDKVSGEKNIGFIAEEFDELGLTNLVNYRDGKPDGLKYELVSLYLLEVVKDLKEKNEELEKRLETLESRE